MLVVLLTVFQVLIVIAAGALLPNLTPKRRAVALLAASLATLLLSLAQRRDAQSANRALEARYDVALSENTALQQQVADLAELKQEEDRMRAEAKVKLDALLGSISRNDLSFSTALEQFRNLRVKLEAKVLANAPLSELEKQNYPINLMSLCNLCQSVDEGIRLAYHEYGFAHATPQLVRRPCDMYRDLPEDSLQPSRIGAIIVEFESDIAQRRRSMQWLHSQAQMAVEDEIKARVAVLREQQAARVR